MIISILFPIIVTILAVILLFSPIDFIPDVIPVIGWTDDMLYIAVALASWVIYFGGEGLFNIIDLISKNMTAVIIILIIVFIMFGLARRRNQ